MAKKVTTVVREEFTELMDHMSWSHVSLKGDAPRWLVKKLSCPSLLASLFRSVGYVHLFYCL